MAKDTKLSQLKAAINEFVSKNKKGKKLKAKKIRKVVGKLEAKEKRFKKDHANESSSKARKKLELQLRVIKAQIKKAHKLLKHLDS
ncbi:hypothetical protein N9H39_05060 [Gammaproteobacteria bacterium]|nr:hypothetical protein [Gammaproteobacteria bacterium]